MIKRGIIVSIQGYSQRTTTELAQEASHGGAVAFRTDKPIVLSDTDKRTLIGLYKVKVRDPGKEAYITPDIESIAKVADWADYVAIDYRQVNRDLKEISDYCIENKIKVVADIGRFSDYEYIKENGFHYDYIATTMSVFNKRLKYKPDLNLVRRLCEAGEKIIGEGNYKKRYQVREAFQAGVQAVCIGQAITNIYKRTREYVSVLEE